jgi:hypothetical protein
MPIARYFIDIFVFQLFVRIAVAFISVAVRMSLMTVYFKILLKLWAVCNDNLTIYIFHAQVNTGINVRKGQITNILEENVVQPLLVSTSALSLATECVRMILKIDDIVSTR